MAVNSKAQKKWVYWAVSRKPQSIVDDEWTANMAKRANRNTDPL